MEEWKVVQDHITSYAEGCISRTELLLVLTGAVCRLSCELHDEERKAVDAHILATRGF